MRKNNFIGWNYFITFAVVLKKQAMMAQLVEQRIRNAWVAGSSPARGSLVIMYDKLIQARLAHR